MKNLLLLPLLLMFCLSASAQHLVKGRVVDAQTGQPLEFVSVYANTTTIGTATNAKGEFALRLPEGKYELIVSFLGYEPLIYQVSTDALPPAVLFKLSPRQNELKEVVIEGTRDKQWYDNLEVFKDRFLGLDEFGRQSKLLNPEILSITFDPEEALLEVKANEPLQVQNDALGYKITYLLSDFRYYGRDGYVVYLGYPRYELMQGSKSKERRWARNRQKAYHGSLMHFVRAVQKEQLEQQGFNLRRLYRKPNPNRPTDEEVAAARAALRARGNGARIEDGDSISDILSRSRLPKVIESLDVNPVPYSEYLQKDSTGVKLDFEGFYQVVYTGEKEEQGYLLQQSMFNKCQPTFQTSVLSLQTDAVLLEPNGNVSDPLNFLVEGYWGWEKLGAMLPLDYQPVGDK